MAQVGTCKISIATVDSYIKGRLFLQREKNKDIKEE
jgi:hypothetical protein